MLRVALREALGGPVETIGEVAPDDPLLKGLDFTLTGPVQVTGRFSSAGDQRYYWRVRFAATARMECRRCLAPVDVPLVESRALIFAADDETPEDEGCYHIPPRTQLLELAETLREELLLAVPRFVECRPDCKGLCATCGKNLNEGPCACRPAGDPRWGALQGLLEAETPKKD